MRRGALPIAAVLLLGILPQLAPENFPADDALFYLQVARNITSGHGSTFNTITPTNGYHPLWMAVCVTAASIAGGDRILLLRIAFAVQVALTLLILIGFRRVGSREGSVGWLVGAAIVAPYFLTGMYGSEAHLNGALLMLGALCLVAAVERPTIGGFARLGIVLGFAILARLDDVFVAATMMVTAAFAASGPGKGRPGAALGRLLVAGLAAAAVCIPYFVYNWTVYGAPLPISGVIKSTFPHVAGRVGNLGSLGTLVSIGALLGIGLATWPGAARRLPPRHRLLLIALGSGVLLHAAYVVLFTNHLTHWSWYYVPGVLNLGALAAALWEGMAVRMPLPTQTRIASAVVAIFFVAAFARGTARVVNPQAVGNNQLRLHFTRGEKRWTVLLSRWLDERLPPGSAMMVFDYPGALAYYSSLRVLPEDGLIGDYGYNRDLVREGAAGYLRARGVRYYMGPYFEGGDRSVEVFAPLGHRSAGFLQLRRDHLVARVRELPRMVSAPDVGIWQLDP